MSDDPILMAWDGEALHPVSAYWAKRADQQWVVGERYLIETQHERSAASHRHYFAALHEAFMNLPEHIAAGFPTVEHLRKRALISTGYRDERSIVAASKAEALRLAAFVRPLDDTAFVSISGTTVAVMTAKSQSMRAMGKAEFQRSKDDVLNFVASLIGISRETLESTGRAA